MNAPGTYPPAPPEHTATACQRNVSARLGEVISHTGSASPTEDDVSRALEILDLIRADCRRWISALHLNHASKHAIRRGDIALGRPA